MGPDIYPWTAGPFTVDRGSDGYNKMVGLYIRITGAAVASLPKILMFLSMILLRRWRLEITSQQLQYSPNLSGSIPNPWRLSLLF